MDYLKIGRADELRGRDRKYYRFYEILPGLLSWLTLILLVVLTFTYPIFIAYFIIAFDVYWLLLVIYLGIHLIAAYKKLKDNLKKDYKQYCLNLNTKIKWDELIHLVILPTYNEDIEVLRTSFKALTACDYPKKNIIVVLATEERGGPEAAQRAEIIKNEFGTIFRNFLITLHPANIEGELKGKGANQTWAAKQAQKEIIDKEKIDYNKILVSVFDIDTVIYPLYFYLLAYKFLTVPNPYRASYQPIPVYHNNIWKAPFFARVAASSNTFWQMMQQIRQEKLATYSSHSMTWKALTDIGFWSTTMVSEDSRIFWHCYLFYNGDYRVEPLHYPVSMDVCMDETMLKTARNLYKQQRRWGWGVENIPYLIFNIQKRWDKIPKKDSVNKVLIQLYGFHSWATNALIICFVGWLVVVFGGKKFNSTALSTNLPSITETLMIIAMVGLLLSAIVSTLLLPPRPKNFGIFKHLIMFFQWIILPVSIILFGAIPGLDAQTRLMFGKYMGFWVTPKKR